MLAGAPSDSKGYHYHQVDGLDIYISDKIKAQPSGIRIALDGWGPFRFITLEGPYKPLLLVRPENEHCLYFK